MVGEGTGVGGGWGVRWEDCRSPDVARVAWMLARDRLMFLHDQGSNEGPANPIGAAFCLNGCHLRHMGAARLLHRCIGVLAAARALHHASSSLQRKRLFIQRQGINSFPLCWCSNSQVMSAAAMACVWACAAGPATAVHATTP